MLRTVTNLTAACLLAYAPAALSQSSAQASADASMNANASARQSEQEGSLAAGTALNAQLDQSVDSKKAKEGDSVTARTTDSVKENGKTVLPKGTKLVGHVTKASAKSKGDAESKLAMKFDRAILKDGREIPLQVSLQALAAAPSVESVSGDDLQPAGGTYAGGGGSSGRAGGVGSTAGAAASGAAKTVPRTAEGATGAVNSTVGGAANAAGGAGTGLGAAGQLTSASRGVFGLNGLALTSGAANSAEGSVIRSAGKNVHLDGGTRMLFLTQAATAVSAQR